MKIYPITLPRWLRKAIDWVIIVLLSPLILYMWLEKQYKERYGSKYGEWQRWFAWYPVALGWYSQDNRQEWVWFETVERTPYSPSSWTCNLYRRPGDETVITWWDRVDPEEG